MPNQYGVKDCEYFLRLSGQNLLMTRKWLDPTKVELQAAFQQYGREKNGSGLSTKEQLVRIKLEFGLDIGYVTRYAMFEYC